ncbi:ATP-binding protein [bacterium]|nr:ATP-binding protein [bacterium]|tara:strand:- start:91 stop:321 length:231 start_codon:yes stop_codon:yes gene_type:complete
MIIRVGVGEAGKEIQLEMAEDTELTALKSQIDNALETSTGTLWLTDKDGRILGVPASKITFIDIGSQSAPKIGFGA